MSTIASENATRRYESEVLYTQNKTNIRIERIIRQRDELSDLHQEIDTLWSDLEVHTRLLDYFIQAEFSMYYHICATLNAYLAEITPTLFQKDIRMQVKTVKVTTNKREKPSIHIVIIYN